MPSTIGSDFPYNPHPIVDGPARARVAAEGVLHGNVVGLRLRTSRDARPLCPQKEWTDTLVCLEEEEEE